MLEVDPPAATQCHLKRHDGSPTHQDDQLLLLRVVGDAEGPHCLLKVFVCRVLRTPVSDATHNVKTLRLKIQSCQSLSPPILRVYLVFFFFHLTELLLETLHLLDIFLRVSMIVGTLLCICCAKFLHVCCSASTHDYLQWN